MMYTLLGFAFLGFFGCSSAEFALDEASAWDTGEALSEYGPDISLRMDIQPTGDGYLPQSFQLNNSSWKNLVVPLQETVRVEGTIVGFDSNPYGSFDTVVPGESEIPIEAYVEISQPGTINGASTNTNEDSQSTPGSFSLNIPAGTGYQFSVIPLDPSDLPFFVSTNENFTQPATLLDIDLGSGYPVYGQVTESDGTPVEGAFVRLIDTNTGVEGPTSTTDDDGYYMLRATQGDYSIRVEGDPLKLAWLPTVETELIFSEDAEFSNVNFDMGNLSTIDVTGYVFGPNNEPMGSDVRIRFTSLNLDNANGKAIFETSTSALSRLQEDLLPGRWLVEFIPENTETSSVAPLSQIVNINTEGNLGDIILPETVLLNCKIRDVNGGAAENALVVLKEVGFDNQIVSGWTDQNGDIEIEVSPIDLDVFISPANTDLSSAITYIPFNPSTDSCDRFNLETGDIFSGRLDGPEDAIGYASISIYDEDDNLYAQTLTDESGAFSFRIAF